MELHEHLHAMVALCRKEQDLTMQDTAEAIGVTYHHLAGSVAKGKRTLTIKTIEELVTLSGYPDADELRDVWLEWRLLNGRTRYIWEELLPVLQKGRNWKTIKRILFEKEQEAAMARKA